MFAVTAQPEVLEADLAAGRVCCPGCDGPLSPWGFAPAREVRMLDGVRWLRPRRACCYACETTHVVVPAWSVPASARRRGGDRPRAAGQGARGWAPQDRVASWAPAGDRARLAAGVRAQGRSGADIGVALGARDRRAAGAQQAGCFAGCRGSRRAQARRQACRLNLGPSAGPWELAVALTGGLLHGRPRDPPDL